MISETIYFGIKTIPEGKKIYTFIMPSK